MENKILFLASHIHIIMLLLRPIASMVVKNTYGNVMHRDCIAFVVYPNSQATMDIMLPSPGLEEPSLGQSHNLLNIYIYI